MTRSYYIANEILRSNIMAGSHVIRSYGSDQNISISTPERSLYDDDDNDDDDDDDDDDGDDDDDDDFYH